MLLFIYLSTHLKINVILHYYYYNEFNLLYNNNIKRHIIETKHFIVKSINTITI